MRFIYLHGFASSPLSRKAQYFAAQLRAAGAQVEVPALEAEGFLHLTVSGQLRVIEQAAQGAPVLFIGSSMGGYLAALYASLHPEVERLLLLAPAFGFAGRWRLRLGDQQIDRWQREGSMEMFHFAHNAPQAVGYGLIEDGLRYPAEPAFAQPALIYHGRQDDIVPLSFSQSFVAQHPNAQLIEMDSGHELTDVMEQIWAEARDFLLAP